MLFPHIYPEEYFLSEYIMINHRCLLISFLHGGLGSILNKVRNNFCLPWLLRARCKGNYSLTTRVYYASVTPDLVSCPYKGNLHFLFN